MSGFICIFVYFILIYRSTECYLLGGMAQTNWMNLLRKAIAKKLPISLHLTFNPEQSDQLKEFWEKLDILTHYIYILILDKELICPFAKLLKVSVIDELERELPLPKDPIWYQQGNAINDILQGPIIAYNFHNYIETPDKVTETFSMICQGEKSGQSSQRPVFHQTIDKRGETCGFISGILDYILQNKLSFTHSDLGYKFTLDDLYPLCRRGDIISSFCQLHIGEHSAFLRDDIEYLERTFTAKPIEMTIKNNKIQTIEEQRAEDENEVKLEKIRRFILEAHISAHLKVVNKAVFYERLQEFRDTNLRMISINIDTENLDEVIGKCKEIGTDKMVIGIAGISTEEELNKALALDVNFIIASIKPNFDFVQKCHDHQCLAVINAMSPQEIISLLPLNPDFVQVCPVLTYNPETFQMMRNTGMWGKMKFFIRDGPTIQNTPDWMEHFIEVVVLNYNFIGKDCYINKGTEEYDNAKQEFALRIREPAHKLLYNTLGKGQLSTDIPVTIPSRTQHVPTPVPDNIDRFLPQQLPEHKIFNIPPPPGSKDEAEAKEKAQTEATKYGLYPPPAADANGNIPPPPVLGEAPPAGYTGNRRIRQAPGGNSTVQLG